MDNLQIFSNPQFGEVRVTELNNEPMFCLADVCKVLVTQKGLDFLARVFEVVQSPKKVAALR